MKTRLVEKTRRKWKVELMEESETKPDGLPSSDHKLEVMIVLNHEGLRISKSPKRGIGGSQFRMKNSWKSYAVTKLAPSKSKHRFFGTGTRFVKKNLIDPPSWEDLPNH